MGKRSQPTRLVERSLPVEVHGLARFWVVLAIAIALFAGVARADLPAKAAQAHALTMELEPEKAEALLLSGAPDEPQAAVELGRALLYRTDYERAAEVLERPEVSKVRDGARLAALARDCARTMAGAVTVRDDEHGVVVRMQDDRDAALVPWIGQVAAQARATLARDLGVELPRPIRVELVRDHFALASMTGLPEQSARTTGTVAVANWGRVAMLTPRATPDGYPWMDTLAHELTHLAIGRGTRDRAPLWFQEGVAKREESRWREPDPSDNYPSPDSLAAVGFDRGLGLDLDKLGPSIAMLPSADQAMVAFAEVTSFVAYMLDKAGPETLPKVLVAMRDQESDDVGEALRAATGKDLSGWNALWRREIAGASRQLPPEVSIGTPPPAGHAKAGRAVRLAALLSAREHPKAVVQVLEPVRAQLPDDLRVRALLGKAFVALEKPEDAWKQVGEIGPTLSAWPEAFALRGFLAGQRGDAALAQTSSMRALSMQPWLPAVACEWLSPPDLPQLPQRAALCEAARRWP